MSAADVFVILLSLLGAASVIRLRGKAPPSGDRLRG